jgi:hypothetical protein
MHPSINPIHLFMYRSYIVYVSVYSILFYYILSLSSFSFHSTWDHPESSQKGEEVSLKRESRERKRVKKEKRKRKGGGRKALPNPSHITVLDSKSPKSQITLFSSSLSLPRSRLKMQCILRLCCTRALDRARHAVYSA